MLNAQCSPVLYECCRPRTAKAPRLDGLLHGARRYVHGERTLAAGERTAQPAGGVRAAVLRQAGKLSEPAAAVLAGADFSACLLRRLDVDGLVSFAPRVSLFDRLS